MVEILAVEIVEGDAVARRSHERIQHLVVEKRGAIGLELIAIIPADNTFTRLRIVRLADARIEHHMRVAEGKRRQDHHSGGLLIFLAGFHVGPGDAGNLLRLFVVIDLLHKGAGLQCVFWIIAQHRHDIRRRCRFGV